MCVCLCVCSGSMEPAFYRGDLLFLTNKREDPIQAGEILVFKVKDRDIPIVHRVIKLHRKLVAGKGSSKHSICVHVLYLVGIDGV